MLTARYERQIRQRIVEGVLVDVVDHTAFRHSAVRHRPYMDSPWNPHIRLGNLDKGALFPFTPKGTDTNRSYRASISGNVAGPEFGAGREPPTTEALVPRYRPTLEGCCVWLVTNCPRVPLHGRPPQFAITLLSAGAPPSCSRRNDIEFLIAIGASNGHSASFHGADCTGSMLIWQVGAGTTGLVAMRLGRRFVGIELNPEYAEMARRRIHGDAPLFNAVSVQ